MTKLLVETGMACSDCQDRAFMNLRCERLQLDEIWSFVGKKARNITGDDTDKGLSDTWTWTAIDTDSKLIPSFFVLLATVARDRPTSSLQICVSGSPIASRSPRTGIRPTLAQWSESLATMWTMPCW